MKMDNYHFEFFNLYISVLQSSVKSPNTGYWPVSEYSDKLDYYSEPPDGHPKTYNSKKQCI
jgi:hypothetical protein